MTDLSRFPPPGYEIVETDIRVDTLLTRYTRRGVERARGQYPSIIPVSRSGTVLIRKPYIGRLGGWWYVAVWQKGRGVRPPGGTWSIPGGYRHEYGSLPWVVWQWFRLRCRSSGEPARNLLETALIPSYHTRVERKTRNPFVFDRWALVAYQNELTPEGDGPGCGSWTCHVCGSPRADAKISVFKDEAKYPSGRTRLGVNVRYCNDRDECREGAARIAKEWMP